MFCITYDTTCYADPQRAFDFFMRQLWESFGPVLRVRKTSGSSHTRSRTGLASTTRRICGPIRTRICRGIGCRDITLSPKSHPKEAAPAPMKRRTIATQTTQTKEITYA